MYSELLKNKTELDKRREAILALHRFWIWADAMKNHFDCLLKAPKQKDFQLFMYMSLFYSLLFVVIEGWEKLKLENSDINKDIESPNKKILNRFRDGCFHYHEDYYDKKFLNLIKQKEIILWIRNLHEKFGRWFIEKLKE